MDIPNNKKAASPITGRSSKKTNAGGNAGPVRPSDAPNAARPASAEDEEDIAVSAEVFEMPVISLPARNAPKEKPREPQPEPPRPAAREVTAPVPTKEPDERAVPKKANLEHREPAQPYQFKRHIRPETAMAAHAAVERARAESPAPLESVDHTAMQFGKIHPSATPDYRPNRLFRVLDSIYTHSPMRWLDFIERGGVRFVAVSAILLIVGGFIAWRFYDSLVEKEDTTGSKAVALTPEERVERGKKTVQEFLAAQTIEARLPLVIDPDRAALRMKQFEENKGQEPNVTAWRVEPPVTDKQGIWLPFIFQDSAGREVRVVIEETDKSCRIDWENFVAFGDMLWPEYCRSKPTTSKSMRVRLRQVERYEELYPKEKYQSYEIEHRSGAPKLTGYAERAGRTGQALAEVVKAEQWQNAQLYLQFENSDEGNFNVIIRDIVRSRWQDEATGWRAP
ncbi:MAG TPA: hypothetical protein VG796_10975 [Verrucomicrobiales bacterium]|nr:hypothetical protein [Verrucomicrobiales bacterium]